MLFSISLLCFLSNSIWAFHSGPSNFFLISSPCFFISSMLFLHSGLLNFLRISSPCFFMSSMLFFHSGLLNFFRISSPCRFMTSIWFFHSELSNFFLIAWPCFLMLSIWALHSGLSNFFRISSPCFLIASNWLFNSGGNESMEPYSFFLPCLSVTTIFPLCLRFVVSLTSSYLASFRLALSEAFAVSDEAGTAVKLCAIPGFAVFMGDLASAAFGLNQAILPKLPMSKNIANDK